MDRETFICVLESVLGERDHYGHFVSADRRMRVKVQRTSWRFEVRCFDCWIRSFGNYYGKTEVPEIAKITRRFNSES